MLGLMLLSIVGLAGAALTLDMGDADEAPSEDQDGAEDVEAPDGEAVSDMLLADPVDPSSLQPISTPETPEMADPDPQDDAQSTEADPSGFCAVPVPEKDDGNICTPDPDLTPPSPAAPQSEDPVLYLDDHDNELWLGERSGSVFAQGGHDTVYSGFENMTASEVYGGTGNDTLIDGEAAAMLDGGDGNDIIQSGHGEATVYGGSGNDTLRSGIHTDTLFGGLGDDTLVSVGTMEENAADQLFGGAGDDVLEVRGTAELTGDEGADTFRTYVNSWADQPIKILDYSPGEDRLEVQLEGHANLRLVDFELSVEDSSNGQDASVFVNGTEVIKVLGAKGLTLGDVHFNVVHGYNGG